MTFVDITMVPVPSDRKDVYVEFARRMASVYLDHGATAVTDYWQVGDSADQTDFHADGVDVDGTAGLANVAGARAGESVVVSITQWPSQAARDRGVAAATKDPRVLATLDEEPVFDGRRLTAASFEELSAPDAPADAEGRSEQ